MKKNVLMKSKRMAAFALSLSMVLAEGSVAGATELNANPNPDSAVVTEADTEATEVDVQETETPAVDQATETASTEEATEQASPEVAVPETEAAADEAVPTAEEEAPAADEVVPEAEADTEETTEEETENADLEEDTEELGAYNGTPSKVIGLEGENDYKGYDEFDAVCDTANVYYSYVNSGVNTLMPGTKAQYVDQATGLYLARGRYYVRQGDSQDNGTAEFSGNSQVEAYVPGDSTVIATLKDQTTGLYVLNGVSYTYLFTNGTVVFATANNRAVAVGTANTEPEAETTIKGMGRNADGTAANAYDEYDYYEVNGRYFAYIQPILLSDGRYSLAGCNEISFDKVKPIIKWNEIKPVNKVVDGQMRALEVGYQVKINDVIANEENISNPLIATSATEGEMFLVTNSMASLRPLVGAGESAKIQVRGVYYVTDESVAADGTKSYSWTVDSTGEWSEPYTFTNTFAGKVPGSATGLKAVPEIGACLNVVQDGRKFKLTWNPVKEAAETQIVEIGSKVPLNISAENFVKFLAMKGDQYLLTDKDINVTADERAALLGTATTADYSVLHSSTTEASSITVAIEDEYKDYTYHYFVVKASGVAVPNEYVNNTTCSNMVTMITGKEANIPQVTGLKVEKQENGFYNLVWNPVDANVVVYAYEKQNLPDYFYTKNFTVSGKDAQGNTCSLRYGNGDDENKFLTAGQKALISKVKYETKNGLSGDDGIPIGSFGLTPGITYYFTAFTYDDSNEDIEQAPIASINGVDFKYYVNLSPASSTVKAKNDLEKPSISTKASKNSVKLTLDDNDSNATGFQIYRLNSKKKWKKIATTTDDVYTDADLKENTKYSYRVRSYFYNKDTKKTIYSDYANVSISTSQVTNIAVKVTMKSTSQAKVSWTKVGKAEKYEIYRSNSRNVNPKEISKKYYDAYDAAQALSTAKYELVKTVKKAKTTSYTDKKLRAGETYNYIVMAYYKDGKTTGYIIDDESITFAVGMPKNVQAENKGTSAKITWNADKFASKFEVRYEFFDKNGNSVSNGKKKVKTTKKNSYTIKGIETGGYARVEVRAYGKNKAYSGWSSAVSTKSLGVAKNVTAKNVTETLANGQKSNVVKISWKKVSGAKYYKVYRSTKTAVYNKDEKKYYLPEDAVEIAKESNNNEFEMMDDNKTESYYDEVPYREYMGVWDSVVGTSAVDRAQLLEGVTYYYSVVAFGEKGTQIASYVTTNVANRYNNDIFATSKPASVVFNADLKIASLKNSKKGQVVVKYNKVNSAKQYVIYRAEKKNGTYKKLGTSKKTSYTDKKAKKGKTYYYKVVATGTNGAKANLEVTSSVKKIKVKK